jgi:hypothetical protein
MRKEGTAEAASEAEQPVKKPTIAELKSQAEREFVEKYNALCDEYGMVITPQLGFRISPKN